jgi:hypothetical protein
MEGMASNSEVALGLCGLKLRRVERAQRMLYRLGIFQNDLFAVEKAARTERRRQKNLARN